MENILKLMYDILVRFPEETASLERVQALPQQKFLKADISRGIMYVQVR